MAAVVVLAGCGSAASSAPTSPTTPSTSPASPAQLNGQAIGALDGIGIAGVSVAATAVPSVMTDGSGFFVMHAPAAGDYKVTLSGSGWVDRQTTAKVPAS